MPTRKPPAKRPPAAKPKAAAKPARRAAAPIPKRAPVKSAPAAKPKPAAKPARKVAAPPKKTAAPPPPPKPKTPPKAGQQPHVPDPASRQRVMLYSGGGIEQDAIAGALGITTPTLVKYYASELATGRATMDGLAISTLARAMRAGGKDGVTAATWWTQSRMGWTERTPMDDDKLADTPIRVIIELVGDAPPTVEHRPGRTRPGFDPELVQLVG